MSYFRPYATLHDAQRFMLLVLQFVQRQEKPNEDKASMRITHHSCKNSDFFFPLITLTFIPL